MTTGLFKKCARTVVYCAALHPTATPHHAIPSALFFMCAIYRVAACALTHWTRCSFTVDENVSTQSKVKSSVLRGILKSIEEQYPIFAAGMEEMLPKKRMNVAKWWVPKHEYQRVRTAHMTPMRVACAARAT